MFKLAAGAATVMLVHFPASFSYMANVIRPVSKATVMIAANFANFSSGTSNRHRSDSHTIPRYTTCVVGNYFTDMIQLAL